MSLSNRSGAPKKSPMAAFLRILALVAVLLMPLGMAPATAAPTPAQHHQMAMPMEHCPDQAPGHDRKAGFAECTMACSAALPAIGPVADRTPLLVCAPSEAAAAQILRGLHLDPVTPPPKRS